MIGKHPDWHQKKKSILYLKTRFSRVLTGGCRPKRIAIVQDEIEYWKIRMCRLTLLVEQVTLPRQEFLKKLPAKVDIISDVAKVHLFLRFYC